jgi:hypothetical protein
MRLYFCYLDTFFSDFFHHMSFLLFSLSWCPSIRSNPNNALVDLGGLGWTWVDLGGLRWS